MLLIVSESSSRVKDGSADKVGFDTERGDPGCFVSVRFEARDVRGFA